MTSLAMAAPRTGQHAAMFRDRTNTIATSAFSVCVLYAAVRFANWALVHAVWTLPAGDGSAACRAARGEGACWAVVHDRARFILFGAYPAGDQWRPALACVLFVALYAASTNRGWWKPRLVGAWLAVPAAAALLMRGGLFGLRYVASELWGGLPLTLLLATVGFSAAIPLAVVLAIGRRSQMPAIRVLSTLYVELVRSVPIITFLFMASVMFPLFVPQGVAIDKVLRAQIAFVLIAAAYLAEVIRAGLNAVPRGQHEAAASLGLHFSSAMLLVVLPQAFRAAIPALVNTFIAFFKDTSLVAVIGLFDMLGAANAAIVDARWVPFSVEVYLFVAVVYFTFCYSVSQYTQRLERSLQAGGR